MALSVEDLAIELRIIGDPDDTLPASLRGTLERLLAYATDAVERSAPAAPSTAKDLAVSMLCGYQFDRPSSASGAGWANAARNSGAAHVLTRWVSRRALPIGGVTADAAVTTTFGARMGWAGSLPFSADQLGALGTAGTGTVTLPASLDAAPIALWVEAGAPASVRLTEPGAPRENILTMFGAPADFADGAGTPGRLWLSSFAWAASDEQASYVVRFGAAAGDCA